MEINVIHLSPSQFAHRVWVTVLIVAVVAGAVLLLWLVSSVALLLFAAVLLAIFLRSLTDWVSAHTGLSKLWALSVVVAAGLVLAGLVGWLLAAPVSDEVAQLSNELPKAFAQLQAQLQKYSWGRSLVDILEKPTGLFSQAGKLLTDAKAFFSLTLKGIIYAWVIPFCGFYLTTQPDVYVQSLLTLIPPSKRDVAKRTLDQLGHALRSWLFGQIVSMSIIGLLTWLGLRLLHIPLAEGLGVLAGVLDFIPVAGPWVAGIISCLLAMLNSPMHAVYVACLFIGLHLFEGHVLVPQVQKHATRLPPVLTILAMLLFEELFGFLGLLLATPLLVGVMVCTKTLYLQEVLGEPISARGK